MRDVVRLVTTRPFFPYVRRGAYSFYGDKVLYSMPTISVIPITLNTTTAIANPLLQSLLPL